MIIESDATTEEKQLKLINKKGLLKDYSTLVKYVKNPSEKVQSLAIKLNINNIYNIEEISENIQLEIVKSNPDNLKKIKNPSQKAIYEAYYQSIAK